MYIHIENDDYLRIEACHYDSYDRKGKGIMVYLTRVERTEIASTEYRYWSEKCIPMDDCNYKFLVCEYKRKSKKKIDMINDYIYVNHELIIDLYKNNKRYAIVDLIRKVAE